MHHNCSGKPQKRIRRGWGDVDTTFRSRGDVVFSLHGCTRIGQASHSSGCDKAGAIVTVLSGAGVMLCSAFIGAPELVRPGTDADVTRLG